MHFKKLEIFGFKSFAEKTVLNFEDGITAIVGPNGCGKSNVFDSIRWVLGEQSIKELRGSAKEDVIFNGTQHKPALGFAEVSLTLSNDKRELDIDYDEVTVTRRLFRSGESEYLLNKSRVRLKDIQALLMGTGIGAETYSLIQQGKVDTVVSARPEERRLLLDEASGITKYKAKKKEAMSKLKSTDDNLLRVNDIVVEVKRQIGSIERQANKAKKYKVEYEKLKYLEIMLAKHQMASIEDKKSEMNTKLNNMKSKETELSSELEEVAERLNNEINFLDEIEQNVNDLKTQEIKIDGQIDLNNRQIGFNQERITNLEQNELKYAEQKEQLKEKCAQQQTKIDELKTSVVEAQNIVEENTTKLEENLNAVDEIEKTVKVSQEKIKENEELLLTLTSQQMQLRNNLTENMKELQGALARRKRLELELQKIHDEKGEVENKFKYLTQKIVHLQGSINFLKVQRVQDRATLDYQIKKLKIILSEIDATEKKKLLAISQKEFIEELQSQYQENPEPTIDGRLIVDIRPDDNHTGIIGKIKEIRVVGEKYEILCENKFIELDPQQITRKIEEHTRESARLTSLKEELQEWITDLESDFERLEQRIIDKETGCSVLIAQRNDIKSETGKLNGELGGVYDEVDEIELVIQSARKREEEVNYKLDTVNQDKEDVKTDIKAKQEAIAQKLLEREEVNVTIAQIKTEIEGQKHKLHDVQANEAMYREVLDGCLEEMKSIDDEVADYETKKESYRKENEEHLHNITELKSSRESLHTSLTEFEAQKEEVGLRINTVRSSMKSIEDELDEIKKFAHTHELSAQELSFKEQAIKDKLIQSYKISYEEILEREEEAPSFSDEVQASASTEDEQQSTADAEAEAEEKVAAVNQEFVFDPETAPEEIRKLRKRCDAFGSVNLVAIEEYEELKERFEFLTQQQADLLEAKSQLMSTINKINRSTRQMFLDTFEKVDVSFREHFKLLFGGGDAQLILLDPDNVLESGIDIVARPPGKKLQNISLLSGGERTMAAIALIFGVFKVKPSPFCVLDEIDAALDDANVDRFGTMLKKFAEIAQFVVITHNKQTISASDILYGVTMPENGISRVVSVKLSDKKEVEELTASAGV